MTIIHIDNRTENDNMPGYVPGQGMTIDAIITWWLYEFYFLKNKRLFKELDRNGEKRVFKYKGPKIDVKTEDDKLNFYLQVILNPFVNAFANREPVKRWNLDESQFLVKALLILESRFEILFDEPQTK